VTRCILAWTTACLALTGALRADAAANLEEGVCELAQQISVNMVNANLKKVALVEFAGLDGEVTAFGQFLAEELTTQLFVATPGRFEVVERRQLQRVLQEHRLSASGLLDATTIASLGKILGIEALITGSIADLGPEVKVNARLIAVESARVFAVAATNVPKTEVVLRLMQQRATGLAMGVATAPAAGAGPTAGLAASGGAPHFRNDFLEATVRSASASSRRFAVAIEVRNRTQNDVRLAYDCYSALFTDDHGNAVQLSELGGLSSACNGRESDASVFTTLGAGSATTFLFESYRTSDDTGTVVSLSVNLWQMLDDQPRLLSMGFSNIPLTKAPQRR
jgi:TolB-like protein